MALEISSWPASWSERKAAWISTVRSSMRRDRPPRRKQAAILARDSARLSSGVGAAHGFLLDVMCELALIGGVSPGPRRSA